MQYLGFRHTWLDCGFIVCCHGGDIQNGHSRDGDFNCAFDGAGHPGKAIDGDVAWNSNFGGCVRDLVSPAKCQMGARLASASGGVCRDCGGLLRVEVRRRPGA